MKNKRGQTFIIAAIIIVIIMAGLTTIQTTTSTKTTPKAIYDISSDLNKEGSEIIDYGIYTGNIELENFLTSDDKFAPYFLKKTDKANIIFIYGNKDNLKAVKYNTASIGTITAKIGANNINWQQIGSFADKVQVNTIGEEIIVTLLNNDYKFKLRDNEMFYFIIVQEKEGEVYVEKN